MSLLRSLNLLWLEMYIVPASGEELKAKAPREAKAYSLYKLTT